MSRKLIDVVFPKRNEKPYTPIIKEQELPICFKEIVKDCALIKNEQCLCLNRNRQTLSTVYETIEVGLELPNAQGELIRFIPRYINIVVYNG